MREKENEKQTEKESERERQRKDGTQPCSRWMLLLIRLWDFKGGLDLFRYSGRSICSWFDVSSPAPTLSRFALLRRALIYTPVRGSDIFT